MTESIYKQLLTDLHKYINIHKDSIKGFTSCGELEEPYISYRGDGTYYTFCLNLMNDCIDYTIYISIKDEGNNSKPLITISAIPAKDIAYTQDLLDLAEQLSSDNTCLYMFKILPSRVQSGIGVAICKQKPVPYVVGANKEVLHSIFAVVNACHEMFRYNF